MGKANKTIASLASYERAWPEKPPEKILEDIKYFREKMCSALGVPESVLKFKSATEEVARQMAKVETKKITENMERLNQLGIALSKYQLMQHIWGPIERARMEEDMRSDENYIPLTSGEVCEAIRQARESFGGDSVEYVVVHPKQYDDVILMPLDGVPVRKFNDDTKRGTDVVLCVGSKRRSWSWNREIGFRKPLCVPFTEKEVLDTVGKAIVEFGPIRSLRVHPSQRQAVEGLRVMEASQLVGPIPVDEDKCCSVDALIVECKGGDYVWHRKMEEKQKETEMVPFVEQDFLTVAILVNVGIANIKAFWISNEQWRVRGNGAFSRWCPHYFETRKLDNYPSIARIDLYGNKPVASNEEMLVVTHDNEKIVCRRNSNGCWDLVSDSEEEKETKCKDTPVEYQFTHSAKFVFPDGKKFKDGCFGPTFEIPEPDPNEGWEKVSEEKLWPMHEVLHGEEGLYKVGSHSWEHNLVINHDIGRAAAREYSVVARIEDACCVSFVKWRRPIIRTALILRVEKQQLVYKGWPARRPATNNPGMNAMMRHYTGPKVGE